MKSRLEHAVIGCVLGMITGTICWFLYGLGFSRQMHSDGFNHNIVDWLSWSGSLFAILGFIFKSKIGDWTGDTLSGIYEVESGQEPPISFIQFLIIVAIIGGITWFLITHHQ